MALVDKDKIEYYKDKDTGLRIDTPDGEKAVMLMGQPGKPIKQRRHQKHWWPDEKKIEAATMYVATGNYEKTAKLTKIPEQTIRRWSLEDWWMLTIQKIRREENATTDKKFSTIVDKALDKIVDRIDNGDFVYDVRAGKVVNIPMSGRDLTIVTGTIFDKRQLIRGEATKITQAANSDEHLKKLATEFTQFVKDKLQSQPKVEKIVIDGEIVDG